MIYSGNCRLGDLFENRREKGRPGLPLLSVTMNDGLVDRDELERKQESSLAPEDHLLVKPGDIAYNMMRMWQGAFGLADQEALVSPSYVVLKPKSRIDPLYASYLFKTPRLAYLFWAYSYGLTDDRLRLYYRDFARIPVSVPTLDAQRHIAETLISWDKAVLVAERFEVANSNWKKGVITEILQKVNTSNSTAGRRKRVKLRDVADVVVSNVDKKLHSNESIVSLCNYTHVYYNRILSKSIAFDRGSASQSEKERFLLRRGDVVITKDSEESADIGVATYVKEQIDNLVCGYHLAIVRPNEERSDGAFLSAVFAQWEVRKHFFRQSNGVTRFGLPVSAIQDLKLSLPSVYEQRRIGSLILQLENRQVLQRGIAENIRRQRLAIGQRLLFGT
ncbi:MAG: restriction endonuclease subunit S [Betaproteobacteria bacterium]